MKSDLCPIIYWAHFFPTISHPHSGLHARVLEPKPCSCVQEKLCPIYLIPAGLIHMDARHDGSSPRTSQDACGAGQLGQEKQMTTEVNCCQGNRLPKARLEECWGRPRGYQSESVDDQLGKQAGKAERTWCPAAIPRIAISSRTQPRERPAKGLRQPGAREDQAHESFMV